jgi:hypothetical protein
LQLNGVSLGARHVISVTADSDGGFLIFNNEQGISGSYTLIVSQMNLLGQADFLHNDIPISTTDTHLFGYTEWGGSGDLVLYIDHGSDGSVDETIVLKNEANDTLTFLPLINK